MRIIKSILVILVISVTYNYSQVNNYWRNAPTDGNKIYTLFFHTADNGTAISAEGEYFNSLDSGKTWNYKPVDTELINTIDTNYFWSCDIYCSVMRTTDNGENWLPYGKEKREHFCRVYLKDPNVGYNTASEFLHSVTSKIISCIKNELIDSIANKPQQCAEYYTNINEGWALGWSLKNFRINNHKYTLSIQ